MSTLGKVLSLNKFIIFLFRNMSAFDFYALMSFACLYSFFNIDSEDEQEQFKMKYFHSFRNF